MPSLHGTKIMAVGRDARHKGGIVAGARDHVAGGIAGNLRRRAHGGDAIGVEAYRRLGRDGLHRNFKPELAADRFGLRGDLLFHAIDYRGVGIAQVDGEEDLAGHDIGRAGLDLEHADGADRRGKLPRRPVDRLNYTCSTK